MAFYARPWRVDLLRAYAVEASISLMNFDAGTLAAFAASVHGPVPVVA